MAFDYSGLVSTAEELIALFGRDVSLVLPPQQPADPAKPWAGRQDEATATDDVTLTGVRAAFLEPREEDRQGQFIETTSDRQAVENVTARVLVAATSLGSHRLDNRWRVVDGARRLEILRAVPVQPGPTLIYYDLLVEL